jgi:aspartyl-tRNA(Asn)/glutamyl-tRNA(Gln) amidotransferase subunit A
LPSREACERAILELAAGSPEQIYVFPTTPTTAPALSDLRKMKQLSTANSAALRHTMPGSFLDMLGIAMPSGHDFAGLPTSVLLSCRRGGDAMLLDAARQ